MAGSMYSVTLTGKVRGDRDAPMVWERVSRLLKLDQAGFRERVLARVPVTLKAVDYEAARRQLEALTSAGADALMLGEDAAPRLWIRDARRTCGPLSMAYVRHALRERQLADETPACLQGDKQWQDLKALAARHPPPAAPAAQPAPPPAAPARKAPAPRQRGPSGRASAAIVIVASLALLAALAGLVALPSYRTARMRAHVQGAIERSAPTRDAVAGYFKANGRFPPDAAAAGVAPSAPGAADRVTVEAGNVLLRFGEHAPRGLRGRHVRLMPVWRDGAVTWTCRSVDLPRAVLPASCR